MKEYKVKPGKAITGRHSRVYRESEVFPETEVLMNIDVAVERGIVEVKESEPEPTEAPSAKRRKKTDSDVSPTGDGIQKKGGEK